MMNITETVNSLRKGVVACMLGILCSSCSTSNTEAKMKLEELIQKLDAANPWTTEKVETALESKLIETVSTKTFVSYMMGQHLYEEGLIIEEVELRLRIGTNKMIRLIVDLSDSASCFTLDRVKEIFPDNPLSGPGGYTLAGVTYYRTKRSWGQFSFGFNDRRPNCLASIILIPEGEE